jgi:hypothetical protein
VKGDRVVYSSILRRDESDCVSWEGVLVVDRIIRTMALHSVRQLQYLVGLDAYHQDGLHVATESI